MDVSDQSQQELVHRARRCSCYTHHKTAEETAPTRLPHNRQISNQFKRAEGVQHRDQFAFDLTSRSAAETGPICGPAFARAPDFSASSRDR